MQGGTSTYERAKDVRAEDGRILAARSAYFRSMLSGGMREAAFRADSRTSARILNASNLSTYFLHL